MIIPKVNVPEGKIGDWWIEKHVVREGDLIKQLGSFFNTGRIVPPGEYTRLVCGKTVVMSDTPDEMRDHYEVVYKAIGNVLIAGLGLGVVANAILIKSDVDMVTVIEKNKEVIDLVGPHYKSIYGDRINIIHADIFKWHPERGAYYDVAWYDVWNTVCGDNYEEMKFLHRRFAKKTGWQGSWLKDVCRILSK